MYWISTCYFYQESVISLELLFCVVILYIYNSVFYYFIDFTSNPCYIGNVCIATWVRVTLIIPCLICHSDLSWHDLTQSSCSLEDIFWSSPCLLLYLTSFPSLPKHFFSCPQVISLPKNIIPLLVAFKSLPLNKPHVTLQGPISIYCSSLSCVPGKFVLNATAAKNTTLIKCDARRRLWLCHFQSQSNELLEVFCHSHPVASRLSFYVCY